MQKFSINVQINMHFFDNFPLIDIKNNEICLSSEKSYVTSSTYGTIINYNASFIRASLETWLKIVYEWRKIYEELEGDILTRFREEIAFSLAAKEKKYI